MTPPDTQIVAVPPPVATPPVVPQPKKKQDLATQKPPVHKPNVAVRTVPHNGHSGSSNNDIIYENGPIPPLPIGRSHVYVEAETETDDYIVVHRARPCRQAFIPGLWFLNRTVQCY
jgi:hypothetical protein